MGKHLSAVAIAAAVFATTPSLFAATDLWKIPASGYGYWNDATNWTAGIPTASTTVLINATGSNYIIDIGPVYTAQAASVTINTPNVTFDYSTNNTIVTPLLDIEAGTFVMGGALSNARVQGPGTIEFVNLGVVNNITIATAVSFTGAVTVNGNLALDSGTIQLGSNPNGIDSSIIVGNITGTGQINSEAGPSGYSTITGSPAIGAGITLATDTGNLLLTGTVNNAGNISATPGHSVGVNGTFTNTGSITLNQATLSLSSASTSSLGTIVRTGSHIVVGALTVPGGNLDLDSTFHGDLTITDSIDASSITSASNASLLVRASAGIYYNPSNFLAASFTAPSVTLSINANISGSGNVSFAGDLLLNNRTLALVGSPIITVGSGKLDGNGTVLIQNAGSSTDATILAAPAGATLTIGAGIDIRTDPSIQNVHLSLGTSNSSFINNGTIDVNSVTATVSLASPNWKNNGTINISSGMLRLSGNARTSDLGTIHNTGGTINFNGLQLDNSNATLSLDADHGAWTASSGGIHNGTIWSAGGSLQIIPTTGFALDGVTLAGDFSNSSFTAAVFSNGTTLSNATLKFSGFESFNGNQTLSGTGTIYLDTGTFNPDIDVSNGTLTIGNNIAIRTQTAPGTLGSSASPLINQGNLASEVANLTLTILASNFTNFGNLSVANRGYMSLPALTNSGNISASNGTLTFGAVNNTGNISIFNATVFINAPFTNTGNISFVNTTLRLSFYDPTQFPTNISHTGDTILSGPVSNITNPFDLGNTAFGPISLGTGVNLSNLVLTSSAGAIAVVGNATINATLAADMVINANASVTGNLTLQNANVSLLAAAANATLTTGHIAGTGQILLDALPNTTGASNIASNNANLTVDSGITIANGNALFANITFTSNFINNGTIVAQTPARIVAISSASNGTFTNNGTININAGAVQIPVATNNANGTINVGSNGTLFVSTFTSPGGTISRSPGSSIYFSGVVNGNGTANTTFDLGSSSWGAVGLGSASLSNLTLTSSQGPISGAGYPVLSNVSLNTDLTFAWGNLSIASNFSLNNANIHLAGLSAAQPAILLVNPALRTSFGNGTLIFDNSPNNFAGFASTLTGLTVKTGTGGGTITGVTNLAGTISAESPNQTIVLNTITTLTIAANGTLQAINGGSIIAKSLRDSGTVRIDPASTFTVTSTFSQQGGVITGGGTLSAQNIAGNINVTGIMRVTGSTLSQPVSLTLAGTPDNWSAKLDIGAADLLMTSITSQSTLANQLKQGYNAGTWNGPGGITSSAVLASIGTTTPKGIALMTGADYTAATGNATFDGATFAPTDNLLKIALLGDTNLDNTVDLSDLSTILNNFGQPSLSWTHGNFDYAPTIDLTDLSDVLNNFGQSLTTPTLADPVTTPEPTSLTLLAFAAPLLLKRRRENP